MQSGTGSQTGTGPVTVKMGTLGGDGLGARATLAPSIEQDGAEQIFTTKKKLTFEGDGDFVVKVNSDTVTFDQVIAKGVTITPGATLSVSDLGNTVLPIGTSVTLINNTSASPISGTFAGLPEGRPIRWATTPGASPTKAATATTSTRTLSTINRPTHSARRNTGFQPVGSSGLPACSQ